MPHIGTKGGAAGTGSAKVSGRPAPRGGAAGTGSASSGGS